MNTVKLPDGQATDLIRRGNLEGDWSPFLTALRCQHPMPLLRFLLARGIGPSTRLLSQGVAANALPLGVAELLVRHGWPLPPTADPCPCVASMASPRLH